MARILVVEDDVLTGMALGEQLRDLAVAVTIHNDAESALAELSRTSFDAAIIDVALPGMHGDTFAKECRRLFPVMAIVLATGLSERDVRSRFASDAKVEILEKPYDFHQIRERLDHLGVSI